MLSSILLVMRFFRGFDGNLGRLIGIATGLAIAFATGRVSVQRLGLGHLSHVVRSSGSGQAAVSAARLWRCRPVASKFPGASHAAWAAARRGQSLSMMANQAVSRLRPL